MSKVLSRRAMLKGAGVCLALPFLDAMYGNAKLWAQQTQTQNQRLFVYYAPNGIHQSDFLPAQTGTLPENLPFSLSSLAALRAQIMLVGNLYNQPAHVPLAGDHARGTGSFLTAKTVFKTDGANIQNGISIDQVIAQQIGMQARFPFLAFGAEGGGNVGGCDSGYSCVYSRNISWLGDRTPAAKEVNVKQAFERLFATDQNGLSPEVRAKLVLQKKSILDFVKEDTQRLKNQLGQKDQIKLDEYFSGVRELERQIDLSEQLASEQTCGIESQRALFQTDPALYPQKVQLFLDLIALAFQCNLSPVATFMQGNAASNIAYSFLGIADGHHQISHHQDLPENFEKLRQINQWTIAQYAYLLDKLAHMPEGEDTVLDHTLCMFSSEIQDGNRHNHDQLPMILAGAKGFFAKNTYYQPTESQKIASLYMTFARYFGIELQSFGDADTAMSLMA
jgi:hypothetical protein